jgi:putative ABC transport system permease protein
MTSLVFKGMAARKLRTVLTAIAIVLGAAMVTGTLIVGHTVKGGFHEWYTQANGKSAAVITGHLTVRDSNADVATPTPPLASSLVEQVRQVPGVAHAEGLVQGNAIVIDRSGNEIGGAGPPSLVSSTITDPALTPLHLVDGRMPSKGNEIAIDTWSASQAKTQIGGTIKLATETPTRTYRVVGLIKFSGIGTDGATFSVVTPTTAREILDRRNQVDRVQIAAAPGTTPAQLVANLKAAHLGSPVALDILTAKADGLATEKRDGAFVDIIQTILLAFGGIALLVGSFVIFNTFSITVAQRTRELALLRTLGAARRQVLTSVILEAAIVAVIASAIGTTLGIAIAAALFTLFTAAGSTLPVVALVLTPGTLVPGFVLGVMVTLIASIVPAVRATRVSPTTALREAAGAERKPGKVSLVASFVLLASAAASLGYGVLGNPSSANTRLLLIGVGSLTLILGTAASASRLVGPIVRVTGSPMRRFGGLPGTLASENARRNPGRTATTSAALMIGIAVVAFFAIFAYAITGNNNHELQKHVRSTYVVAPTADGAKIDGAVAGQIARLPGVASVSAVSREVAQINGKQAHATFGVNPKTFLSSYRFVWKHGSDAVVTALGAHDALMTDTIATDEHVRVGQTFSLRTPAGTKAEFRLVGTFDDQRYLGGIVIPKSTWHSLFESADASMILANLEPGSDALTTEAAIRTNLERHHGVRVQSHDEIQAANQADSDKIVALVDAMLALSLIISLFGIVNTLILSVLERTREIGLMRAVGASRRQVRRAVRYESVLTAYVGGVLGLGLGVAVAALVVHALKMPFSVPVGQLIPLVSVCTIAGILAGALPARRASRLNVLDALAHD